MISSIKIIRFYVRTPRRIGSDMSKNKKKRPRASPFKPNDRVLIVTAHPDDECMFFGPTLCHLADRNIQAKVLCLSTGNFYGKGDRRTKELEASCKTYAV